MPCACNKDSIHDKKITNSCCRRCRYLLINIARSWVANSFYVSFRTSTQHLSDSLDNSSLYHSLLVSPVDTEAIYFQVRRAGTNASLSSAWRLTDVRVDGWKNRPKHWIAKKTMFTYIGGGTLRNWNSLTQINPVYLRHTIAYMSFVQCSFTKKNISLLNNIKMHLSNAKQIPTDGIAVAHISYARVPIRVWIH